MGITINRASKLSSSVNLSLPDSHSLKICSMREKNFSLALFSLLSSALGPGRENVLSKDFFFFCPPLTVCIYITRPLIVRQGMLDNAEESLVAEARRSFFPSVSFLLSYPQFLPLF